MDERISRRECVVSSGLAASAAVVGAALATGVISAAPPPATTSGAEGDVGGTARRIANWGEPELLAPAVETDPSQVVIERAADTITVLPRRLVIDLQSCF